MQTTETERKGIEMTNDGELNDADFELPISIPLSLDEAETVAVVLDEADEGHLAAHVRYCIQEAKDKAGV